MGESHYHHRNGHRPGPPGWEALQKPQGDETREKEAALGNARRDAEVERSQLNG